MGDMLVEMAVVDTPEHLQEVIESDVVSLILFCDQGGEETAETQWFQVLSSLGWSGPRINFLMVDNGALRRAGREGAEGVWLFARRDSNASIRLPVAMQSEADLQNALFWILGVLAGSGAKELAGFWLKS